VEETQEKGKQRLKLPKEVPKEEKKLIQRDLAAIKQSINKNERRFVVVLSYKIW
jgi:hypothetical protein